MRVRSARLDNHFQRAFGVPVEPYWRGLLGGFDIVRFDEEVLRSGDRPVREVVRERVTSAYRGEQVDELVEYVRQLL